MNNTNGQKQWTKKMDAKNKHKNGQKMDTKQSKLIKINKTMKTNKIKNNKTRTKLVHKIRRQKNSDAQNAKIVILAFLKLQTKNRARWRSYFY